MPQSHLRTKFFSVGKSSISIPSQLLAHVPAWNHHGDYNVHSQMCPVGEAVTHRHLIKLVLEGIGSSYCRTWEAAGFDSSRTTVFSSKIFSFSSACDPFVFFICVTYSMSLPFKTVAFYEVECCGWYHLEHIGSTLLTYLRTAARCHLHLSPGNVRHLHSGPWGCSLL